MAPPITLWQRDIQTDLSNVKNTFSSWDSCMAETYCKWPAIVGIVVGGLIIISLLWCFARILFCGAECCFCIGSCMRCCTCCCRSSNSPRSRPQAQPAPYNQPYQYQSAAPPQYTSGPQYAQFDAPSKGGYRSVNEDSLPSMPAWENATSRKVEDHDYREDEAVEMSKLDTHTQQAQPMLPRVTMTPVESPYARDDQYSGDLGVPQPYDSRGYGHQHNPYTYNPTPSSAPVSPVYAQQNYPAYPAQNNYAPQQTTNYGYNRVSAHDNPVSPSVYSSRAENEYVPRAPPSYHSRAPSQGIGRKPVSGSWREI
ncbi:hypothetical protein MBLNU457_3385t1 [Dothideomycetes sp. NU457]